VITLTPQMLQAPVPWNPPRSMRKSVPSLVGEGKTNKEIASQLYLSPKTIEYHLANAPRRAARS